MSTESLEKSSMQPSFQPSIETPIVIENNGLHTIQVDPIQKLDDFQAEQYEKVIENLTASFGHMLDDPYILSNCTLFQQNLGSNGTATMLLLGFSIRYESKFGHPVIYYPYLLQDYINSNLQEITSLMRDAFLDNVVRVYEVKIYDLNNSSSSSHTPSNTKAPSKASRIPSSLASENPAYFSTFPNKQSNTPSISRETPSFFPSTLTALAIQKRGRQPLQVDPLLQFDPFQVGIYEKIMQNYTASFGHMVGEPFIITICNVTEQQFVSNGVTNQLLLSFNLRYESRFGYNVADYTRLFQSYINDNLDEVTVSMQEHFLTNVVEAGRVQMFLTRSPTFSPTVSSSPTFSEESIIPPETSDPSMAPSFSSIPTVSLEPSSIPSLSAFPTAVPTSKPSFFPSTESPLSIQTSGMQFIEVDPVQEFNDFEVQVYQRIMQNFTASFGHMVGIPFIVATCTVIEQAIATTGTDSLLLVVFTMRYESQFGYDVKEYPSLFQRHINDNLDAVSATMRLMFLENVVNAQRVQMFQTVRPTYSPTAHPTGRPTNFPTINPTVEPTDIIRAPSGSPTDTETTLPSMSPSQVFFTYAPTRKILEENGLAAWEKGLVGVGVGLFGSVVLIALFFSLKKLRKKQTDSVPDLTPISQLNGSDAIKDEEGPGSNTDDAFTVETSLFVGSPRSDDPSTKSEEESKVSADDRINAIKKTSLPQQPRNNSPFTNDNGTSARLNEIGSIHHVELENMRKSIVRSVQGSDPMVSVAMARALMDGDDEEMVDSWNEAFGVDCFEANCLCETHEWLRRQDDISLDSRAEFFQELLNKVIAFVHRGLILSDDATRTIHECATMLGLPLETKLPDNVLLITSLRKSNSLEDGRFYLRETFDEFGQIETAALAPRNHGFGFVRFYSPKSVQRAMRAFRVTYIEVQDTAVMLKTLTTIIEDKEAHGHLKS